MDASQSHSDTHKHSPKVRHATGHQPHRTTRGAHHVRVQYLQPWNATSTSAALQVRTPEGQAAGSGRGEHYPYCYLHWTNASRFPATSNKLPPAPTSSIMTKPPGGHCTDVRCYAKAISGSFAYLARALDVLDDLKAVGVPGQHPTVEPATEKQPGVHSVPTHRRHGGGMAPAGSTPAVPLTMRSSSSSSSSRQTLPRQRRRYLGRREATAFQRIAETQRGHNAQNVYEPGDRAT